MAGILRALLGPSRADREALRRQRAAEVPRDTAEAQRRHAEHELLAADGSLGAVQADAMHRDSGAEGRLEHPVGKEANR